MNLIIGAFLLGTVASPASPSGQPVGSPAAAPAADEDDAPPKSAPSAVVVPQDRDDDERDDAKPKAGTSAQPRDKEAQDEDDDQEGHVQPSSAIVVTAQRLDAARMRIDAALGATLYSLTNDAIENRPGGETGRVSDILMQAPGVVLSGTRLNVRGSPANQVRINDVIIPEAISDPADLLSSRLADTTRLITGSLPAEFGFAPAGVISVTTKNGLYQHGGQAELFGSTDGMIEPAFEWAGSAGATSLFASGELEHDRSTRADTLGNPALDHRTAVDGLAFADHVIDANNRLSFLLGGSHERHRIGSTSIGPGTELNNDAYGVATFQHSDGGFTLQTSVFTGFQSSEATFGSETRDRRSSWGTQVDAAQSLDQTNTIRFGLLATRSRASDFEPVNVPSRTARTSLGLYAQDEWKLAPTLTFNPGMRIEWLRGLGSSGRAEPRASLVFEPAGGWTMHAGYARYASAPPAGEGPGANSLPDERDDFFDAGMQRKAGALTLGIDGYWRSAKNYIAQHETIGSAVATAFAFKHARIKGVEFSATYARGPTTSWANVSLSRAEGRTILGPSGIFAPDSVASAAAHFVPLGSDRPVTASGGVTRRLGKFSLGADVLFSSGAVRTLAFAQPNGARHSAYAVLGLSAVYHARIAGEPADLRLDFTNIGNVHYVTTDATSLEGGWTRWGARRAITLGIEQGF